MVENRVMWLCSHVVVSRLHDSLTDTSKFRDGAHGSQKRNQSKVVDDASNLPLVPAGAKPVALRLCYNNNMA